MSLDRIVKRFESIHPNIEKIVQDLKKTKQISDAKLRDYFDEIYAGQALTLIEFYYKEGILPPKITVQALLFRLTGESYISGNGNLQKKNIRNNSNV